jgi:hypothetical protein
MILANRWSNVELCQDIVADIGNWPRLRKASPDCRSDSLESEVPPSIELKKHHFIVEFTRNLPRGFFHDRRNFKHTMTFPIGAEGRAK